MRLLRILLRTTTLAHLKWLVMLTACGSAGIWGAVLFLASYTTNMEVSLQTGYAFALETMRPEMERTVAIADRISTLLTREDAICNPVIDRQGLWRCNWTPRTNDTDRIVVNDR